MKFFTLFLAALLVSQLGLSQTKEGDFHLDKDFKISANGTLTLNCSDARVTIKGSSRTTAHVKIDRDVESKGLFFGHREFAVDIDENGGDLSIRERSNGTVSMVGYYNVKYTILIEVPEGINLEVRGDDGNYSLTSIHGAIDMRLDDADLDLIGCKGNNFKFRLDDGDIHMDQGAGRLEIDADDADIDIRHAGFTEVIADVDDGDILIQTSIVGNGHYLIDAQDGLISFTVLGGGGTFEVRHDDARVTAEGGFKVVEKTENHSQFTFGDGSARVDLRADDARVRLIGNQ
ncbi:MAG: DUF4097 family beta strand repeat-containing protein [Cyclobacteriaceae bacterium]|nr:DUF4097 family beta strand repeat-containing protein [Cyclobacteriaceae bacterium]